MSLDINGYNAIFKSFVEFARTNGNLDKGRAILDATPTFSGLETGDANKNPFGKALFRERVTVDLTPDVPVVTDVRISQELR